MAEITLKATIRDYRGRSASNKARRSGRTPGIFYFADKKNIPIEVATFDLRSLVYTAETHLVNLELSDGTREKCVLREVQFDPVTDRIMHIDLTGIVMDEKMKFEVPVVLEGTPVGVRDGGGVLQQVIHKLEVECLPTDLPQQIAVDISALHTGDSVTSTQITIDGVTILGDPEQVIALVGTARVVTVTEEEEVETDLAEPEVVSQDKDSEEEG